MTAVQKAIDSELIAWLNTFSEKEMLEIITIAAEAVGLRIEELMGEEYPPEPPDPAVYRGVVQQIRTDKQRRWWWGMMHLIATGQRGKVPDSLRGWRAAYRKVKGKRTLVLSGHYKRTGTLVRSLGVATHSTRQGAVIEVGPGQGSELNDAGVLSYSEYVLGEKPPDGHQARIHQGRWVPLMDLLSAYSDELYQVFVDSAWEELLRRNSSSLLSNVKPNR